MWHYVGKHLLQVCILFSAGNVDLNHRFFWGGQVAFLEQDWQIIIVYLIRHLRGKTQYPRRHRCRWERSSHWETRHGRGAGLVCGSSGRTQQQGCQPRKEAKGWKGDRSLKYLAQIAHIRPSRANNWTDLVSFKHQSPPFLTSPSTDAYWRRESKQSTKDHRPLTKWQFWSVKVVSFGRKTCWCEGWWTLY